MHNRLLQQSMESIHFQDGKFGSKIEIIIDNLRDRYQSGKSPKSLLKELSETIENSTGIKVNVKDTDLMLAAVYVPTINIDHVFLDSNYREYHEKDLKTMIKLAEKHKETSVIDLKNSRVEGIFSRINNDIILCLGELFRDKNPFTTPEITAILLHEIGHLFVCFEYASRTITSNQAISMISKALMGQNPITEYEYVLKVAGKLIAKDAALLKECEEITDMRLISTVIIDKSNKQAKSELNTPFYDYNTFEYLADQFAARHGYGRHLITGLDKLIKNFASFDHSVWPGRFADITTILTTIVSSIILAGGIAGMVLFPIFVNGIILFNQILGINYLDNDFTYDKLKVRYQRIREQDIQFLKLNHIDEENKLKVIRSLDQMKTIIDSLVIYEPIYQRMYAFFSSKVRDAKAAVQLQRDLEELASNELFVKAAKLSTLTT